MTNSYPSRTGASAGPTARPHYFGALDRRRFSMVHWPDGPVRGGAVICPPLAQEAVCAHASLRQLGEQLAARGVVAMRIDLDGTFNSVGDPDDPARLESWRRSILDALAELRSWGVGPIHVVGLRFGATLASEVIADGAEDVGGAVLWDPVLSGRRYARELQMFSAASGLRPPPIDGISIAGIRFGSEALGELKSVNLRPLAVPALLIARSERSDLDGAPAADLLGPATERRELTGTEAMLDTDVELSVVPGDLLAEIADWVDHHMPTSGVALDVPALVATAREHVGDVVVVHTARRVGDDDLFVITTALEGHRPTGALLMLNNGLAPLVGPGRAWVELASTIAQRGWAAVRMDVGGIGDSPGRPGVRPGETYPIHGGSDVAEVLADLRVDGVESVAVVGLCSGALLGFDAAVVTDVDVIVSINGRFDRPFTDARRDRPLRAARPTNRLLAVPLGKTPLLPYFARIPTFAWRLLDRLRLVADPTHAIRRAVDDGRRVVLVTGEEEWGLVALRRRGGRRFAALVADPRVTLWVHPDLDHSMFDLQARSEVLDGVITQLSAQLDVGQPCSA